VIGIVVILAVSWLLIYSFERNNLHVLGFHPLKKITALFGLGFIISCLLCFSVQVFESWLKSTHWLVNPEFKSADLLYGFWWDLKSVVTEELVFRWALLYILIKKIGVPKSLILSAIAFGIYHWFSYGIFGQIVPMLFIFIGTGFTGYVWAKSFVLSQSIMLPIGLHLGWNFTSNTLFSKGPLDQSLIVSVGGFELSSGLSLLNFMLPMIIVPLITLFLINKLYNRKNQYIKI